MSQQKDQMNQNDLLRESAQGVTQETSNSCIVKLEFLERTDIKAEQLIEILKRIIYHIPFHSIP